MRSEPVDWVARARAVDKTVVSLIDGEPLECGEGGAGKCSPRDGDLLYKVPEASATEVDRAVSSSRRAGADWARWNPAERCSILEELARLIEVHHDELALLEAIDVGKPIDVARAGEIRSAAELIRTAARLAATLPRTVHHADLSSLTFEVLRPVGVVAAIVGWNFPLVLAAGKIGPALAMGNAVVLKPSELSVLSAIRLGQLALEAGVPRGVLNVLQGGPATGARLALHPDIDLLGFTGSTETGRKLMVAAGESNMKRLILECGGKAAAIVFEDSPDLDAVADAVVAGAFHNQGQVCTAYSRLLVHDAVGDALVTRIHERLSALVPGDPLVEGTRFGPLVSAAHRSKVEGYIKEGLAEGATLGFAGDCSAVSTDGSFVAPHLFDRVDPSLRMAREEIFGPVLPVIWFRDEQQALAIANATPFGLSAAVWTQDAGRAHRLANTLRAGWVAVNATGAPRGGPGAGLVPVSPNKQSGLGAEGGLAGLRGYTEQGTAQIFI